MHHFAMLEQDLICHPIRNVIHPNGARIQKKDRNPKDEKQDSFADLKKRDQLEITNAVLRPQNLEVSRGMRHRNIPLICFTPQRLRSRDSRPPACFHRDLQKITRNNQDCIQTRFAALQGFVRRLRAQFWPRDLPVRASPPKKRSVSRLRPTLPRFCPESLQSPARSWRKTPALASG